MLKNKEKPKKDWRLTVLAFQICVIANSVFGSVAQLYVISKFVMLAFFGVMAMYVLWRNGRVTIGTGLLLPAVFIIYSIVSVMWSTDKDVAMSQLSTQVQLILLLFFTYLVIIDGGSVKDYMDALYIAGFCMLLYALIQYRGLSNYLLAMVDGGRMGGEITNQNVFGLVFAKASLGAAYYAIIKKKKWNILSIILFGFFAFSSGSKKATALVLLGIVCMLLVTYGIKRIYKSLLIGTAVVVVVWLVLQLPIFSMIYNRLESFFSGELNDSDLNRQGMIRVGMEFFKQRPVFGYGLSNFSVLDHPYRGTYSHNNYVELLVSLGVVGFAMYYLMLVSPAYTLFLSTRTKTADVDKLKWFLLLLIGIEIVFGYGAVQFYEKSPYILIGIALAEADKLKIAAKQKAMLLPQNGNKQTEQENGK